MKCRIIKELLLVIAHQKLMFLKEYLLIQERFRIKFQAQEIITRRVHLQQILMSDAKNT
jgi:acyl-CoA thioesterase FadM